MAALIACVSKPAFEFLGSQAEKTRELEAASLALERDEDNTAPAGNDWLRMLIAPVNYAFYKHWAFIK